MDATTLISTHDKDVLRRLAERKVQLASDPINEERRKAWLALDSGKDNRVMVAATLLAGMMTAHGADVAGLTDFTFPPDFK